MSDTEMLQYRLVLFACPTELPPAQYQNVQLAAQKLAAEAWNKQYTFRIAEVFIRRRRSSVL